MAQRKEETRIRILNAALDAFEAKGFAASTMDEVAQGAGVAKGTLYNYFSGKEALLEGLAEDFARGVHEQLRCMSLERGQPLRERIITLVEPLLANGPEPTRALRVLRVVWGEGLRNPKLTEPIYRKCLEPVIKPGGLITELLKDEDLPQFIRDYPIAVAAPLVQGIMLKSVCGEKIKVDLKDYFERYLEFALKR